MWRVNKTLIFDFDTWFKITANFLPQNAQKVKYELNWANQKENMLWTKDFRLTDGWIDGRTGGRSD